MRLGGLIILYSEFNSAILFTSLSCIRIISFWFSITSALLCLHSKARLRHSFFFFSLLKTYVFNLINFVLVIIRFPKFRCFFCSTYFCVSCSRFSSTVLLTMSLFSCCLLIFFLGTRWFQRFLVVLPLAYFHRSLPGPFIHQNNVGAVDKTDFSSPQRVIYISFSALSNVLTHCGVSMWRDGLSSLLPSVISTVGIYPGRFYIKFLLHFHKYIQ